MNVSDFDRSMGIVEDALQSYPQASAPASLRPRIMRRVRRLAAAPRFAFPWLETAISLMVSTMVTGLLTCLVGIPPSAFWVLRQNLRLFLALPASRPILAAAAAGLAMLFLCVLVSAGLFRKTRRMPAARPRWH
jgi:hypothetical protein